MELLLVGSSLVLGSGCTPRLVVVQHIPKASFHSLDVLLNHDMLLYQHIAMVIRNTYSQLRLVCQLHFFQDKKELTMVTHALVMSWVDRNTRYMGLPLSTT